MTLHEGIEENGRKKIYFEIKCTKYTRMRNGGLENTALPTHKKR